MKKGFLGYLLVAVVSPSAFAAVKFKCDAPAITKPQTSNGVIKAIASQVCRASIQSKGEFNEDAVKSVLLATLKSAKEEVLVRENAVPGNGYEWVYTTNRSDNTPVGNVSLTATEKITSFANKVVYSNQTTSIKADGLAANLKETSVQTTVELAIDASGNAFIVFSNSNTGSVKQGFLTGLLSGKMNELLQEQVGKSTQTTIQQLEKALN